MSDTITLAHGNGGKAMQWLIEEVIMPCFANETLNQREDQARLALAGLTAQGNRLAYSTDSFVVDPPTFPGGDIGKLAVCGTANDIAMCGARPLFISVALIIEEGLPIMELRQILYSMAQAALEADIQIVTGDTKVVPKGAADKLFINTSGIGAIPEAISWGANQIKSGDKIIVSDHIGSHGATILNMRENLGFSGRLTSDCRHLYPLVNALLPVSGIKALRDATRGGINAVLHEFAAVSGCGFQLHEQALPVTPEVHGLCELLGLEPVNFANEGTMLVIVSPEQAETALRTLRQVPGGKHATLIGDVNSSKEITITNHFGGSRWLDLPWNEPMPRIC